MLTPSAEGSCVSAQDFGLRAASPTQPVHTQFTAQALILAPAHAWETSDLLWIHHRFDLLTGSKSSDPDEAGRLCYVRWANEPQRCSTCFWISHSPNLVAALAKLAGI